MTSLARIRRVPAAAGEQDADIDRIEQLYREAREHDQAAYDKRREGEDIIRARFSHVDRGSRDAGKLSERIVAASKLTKQRLYQILQGPTVKPLEESNGNGSTA